MIWHLYIAWGGYRFGKPSHQSVMEKSRVAVASPVPLARAYRCLPTPRRKRYRYIFGRDSDLEAFSHNPSDGSLAPLAYQPST